MRTLGLQFPRGAEFHKGSQAYTNAVDGQRSREVLHDNAVATA